MLSIEDKAAFLNIACALSPENLFADGLRSRADAAKLKTSLMRQWRDLEAKCGTKVREEETYRWVEEVVAHERAERAKALAAEQQHPLLQVGNRGVWVRNGGDGRSAYYILGPAQHGRSGYEVYSEFGCYLLKKERIGVEQTLTKAVEMGEAFLATVTFESFQQANPLYTPENTLRQLKRLPESYLEAIKDQSA